jgi:mycothiol S-conjugate amidase
MPSPSARRRLLTIHAHPDDESEFGAATVARYHREGARTVLVCCTDGGSGRILNAAVGAVGERSGIAGIRHQELLAATAIVGYDQIYLLDFPDSGSVHLKERAPGCFARVPLEEPVRRVVEVIRRERPQVIVSYGDDQRVYPHPDHLRAHEVAVSAFDLAGRGDAFPEAGAPWQPLKLYYTVTSRQRRRAINEGYQALGMDAPFTAREGAGLQGRGDPELAPDEATVTTRIDVARFAHVWIAAMGAHQCQLKPALMQTLSLPAAAVPRVYATEEYVLARDLTVPGEAATADGQEPGAESDLFARVP